MTGELIQATPPETQPVPHILLLARGSVGVVTLWCGRSQYADHEGMWLLLWWCFDTVIWFLK